MKDIKYLNRSYTNTSNRLSTVVDSDTMEKVYHDLENTPKGTAGLNKLLKLIDCDKRD